MDTSIKRIGLRIGSRRRELGITQDKLAEAVGKSTKQISAIEKGRSCTGLETFLNICAVLDATPDFFCMGVVREKPEDEIMDNLRLCSREDIENLQLISQALAKKELDKNHAYSTAK